MSVIYQNQKLTPDDGGSNGSFGYSVALDGETALVGANTALGYTGAAYVFAHNGNTWTPQARLTASDSEYNSGFGIAVALDGDTALVGAEGSNALTGAAYVFIRSGATWTQQARLMASDGKSYDEFGISVALAGDTALIGTSTGAIYVFVRSDATWTQQAKLIVGNSLIHSIAFTGDTMLAGVGWADSKGAAYVFVRSGTTWTQQAKLTASDGKFMDYFGVSVALDSDTALVGANSAGGDMTGTAYVFVRSGTTWTQQAKLLASDGKAFDYFGTSVALMGDTAFLGAPRSGDHHTGGAYRFVRSGGIWTEQTKLMASDGQSDDAFGSSVALVSNTVLVGAYHDNEYTGAVYVFPAVPDVIMSLLVNGSFEVDADNNYVPDGWSRKDPVGDGIRCNKPEQSPIAYDGQCAYLFKPDTAIDNRLTQNVDLNAFDLQAGDQIKLTGFYNKQSTGSVRVSVYVDYINLPQDQGHITLTKTTTGYQPVNPIALTLKAQPTRIRVVLQNDTTSGKTWFDAMSLKLITANGRSSEVVPLPVAPVAPVVPLPVP